MSDRVQQLASQEINDLIAQADGFISIAKEASNPLAPEDIGKVTTRLSRTGQLIDKLYGSRSQHFDTYKKLIAKNDFRNTWRGHYTHVCEIQGLLRAIEHELKTGLVADFKNLLRASIFADFLEMAEYLLSKKYKDSAAVMIGAVLEDSLRKLADTHSIPVQNPKGRPLTIDPLNTALAKANVYSPLIQKQITSWAHVRNAAAHGEYGEYDIDQVNQMLLFVQKFCSDYLQ
jgi:hypothetical protein